MSDLEKVPYSKYLHILFLTNVSDDEIREAFRKRNLIQPTSGFLKVHRMQLWESLSLNSQRFYGENSDLITDLSTLPDEVIQSFKDVGLEAFLTQRDQFEAANGLFNDVDLRTAASALIFLRCPMDEIYRGIESLTKYKIVTGTLEVFKDIFCDVDSMNFSELKEYFYKVHDVSVKEATTYMACFSNMHDKNSIKFILNIDVSDVNMTDMMHKVMSLAYSKGIQHILRDSMFDHAPAMDYMSVFFKAFDRTQEGSGALTGKDFLAEARLKLTRVKTEFKKIEDLDGPLTKELDPVLGIEESGTDDDGGAGSS
jgi:hypothetical protein